MFNLARMTVSGTPGTGSITLNAASSGFLTFALAGVVDGDVVYYAINDGVNSEIGIGTYTASGTSLSRDTVLNSTNAGAKINATSAATILITPPASAWREILVAARTYYVRTDGSDSNTGLANTAGGAFLTIQKAVDVACSLDLSIYSVTIQIGNGTYTEAVTLKTFVGGGTITLRGDPTTPSNVVISTTSSNAIIAASVLGTWSLTGFRVQTTTSGHCIVASRGSVVTFASVDFGACAGYHINLQSDAKIFATGNYSISGSATYHWSADGATIDTIARTVTLTGTPAFSGNFAISINVGKIICHAMTFSGSATGSRYSVSVNSVIYTGGGGASYLPGNAAGSAPTTGGQYV